MKQVAGKFVRFCLVGFTGVGVDMLLLFLLSDPMTLHWGLTQSKLVAGECAIINNFYWNDRWTFGDVSKTQHGWQRRLQRLLKFNVICLLGLAINVTILNICFNYFGMNRYLANMIAILCTTFWNFFVNFRLNWRAG